MNNPNNQSAPPVVAFFDVDNTLMRGASLFHFARGLYARDYFRLTDVLGLCWAHLRFHFGGEGAVDLDQVQSSALSLVKGHRVSELHALGESIYDELMVNKIWPGTFSLLQAHQAAGHQVWLVTATPAEVADVIAARLGLAGAVGTQVESINGRYTGRLVDSMMHGPQKAAAIAGLAETHGWDLAQCFAYSDSVNDVPMLQAVGNPVVVNPDSSLRKFAVKENWPVHDFRQGRKRAKKSAQVALSAMVVTWIARRIRKKRAKV